MTKDEVRARLMAGENLDSILHFIDGQECMIFKVSMEEYESCGKDEVVYVPDIDLNEIPVDKDLSVDIEGIFEVLGCCYTKGDFFEMCEERYGKNGSAYEKAAELFDYVDWQNPGSALDAGEIDDEED